MEHEVLRTLSEVVDNSTKFNVRNISYFASSDDIIYIDFTIFHKYRNILNGFVKTYETTPEHRKRYRYRPGLLAKEFYGTTELDVLILLLNGYDSPSTFRVKKTIKMIPEEQLEYFYNNFILQRQESLEKNKEEVGFE